ncbi:MAG TPA: hypothetical protein VH325_09630 [Bryobacteraceae bacterium]|jgi:hypothetical protein|nr:hypothetical protein [Bryobacteraceae bacterium]
MANYISSNANRFYAALEANYGQAAAISATNRFPAVQLIAQQSLEQAVRHDKTGSRTFLGIPTSSRRQTAFEVRTYLTSWSGAGTPGYGPLFQSALGGTPQSSAGLVVASTISQGQIQTTAPHGLSTGSGVSFSNEIRFVTSVPDASTLVLNAPFSSPLSANSPLAPAITYALSTQLPSLTLMDYWDPSTAVNRLVTGAAADTFQFAVNGDFHEFTFRGPAADLLDTTSFVTGSAGLASFPAEPTLGSFDYSVVPGHLGQVWIGAPGNQFFTLTSATLELNNNIEVRNREFGSSYPQAIAPGMRRVSSQFTLFAQDDTQTESLYAAAKARNPVAAMLQLGQQQGQLLGIYLPKVTPEIPNFNDSQTRLQWEFKNNLAHGMVDDEFYIAFA